LAEIDKDWPALGQISLSTSHQDDSVFFRPSPLRTFERSPQLTKAVIKQLFLQSFALPWDNLVRLELHRAAAYEVFNAIKTCKNLQVFHITLALELQQWEGPQPFLLLTLNTSITHFTFAVQQVFANRLAQDAFRGLRLPELKSLVFRLPSKRSGENTEFYLPTPFPLHIFTPNFSTQLESLTIHSGYLMVEDFLKTILSNPSLRLLDLRRVSWDDSCELGRRFFRPVEVTRGTRPWYLPNLRTFKFEGEIDFAPEVIIRCLESRWDEAVDMKTLESITFIGSGKEWVITDVHNQKFEEWNDRGFSVTIR
jgi:hypothetical protein